MFSAFTNCFKIPELRQRIFLTLGLIFIARVGAGIPLPGVDPTPLQAYYASASSDGSGLAGLYNMFTGGAMMNGALFALGVMPYISASIILQLLGAVLPSLARLMQEGDSGRQKIAQYTRYLTLLIAGIQGTMIAYALVYSPQTFFQGFDAAQFGSIIVAGNIPVFFITSVIFMTTGCMILTWLGEQITQRGIGNGVSIIITVGIIDTIPAACSQAYEMIFNRAVGAESATIGTPQAIAMLVLLIAVTAGVILLLQALRRVPVQYAKRVVGRKVMGGQSSYIPLKLNYAGVMPIIFASALMMFPQQVFGSFNISIHNLIYGILVFGFSYFWVSIMFKPLQISDELKRNGGYIPGVRPGETTAKFLDYVMTRLTFAGGIFLVIIAVLPSLLMSYWGIPAKIANFFGGTGALIAVGVSLDTMRQVETYLLQRHYDGFLKQGRIRGRSVGQTRQVLDTREIKNLWALWTPLLIIFFIGLAAWVVRKFA